MKRLVTLILLAVALAMSAVHNLDLQMQLRLSRARTDRALAAAESLRTSFRSLEEANAKNVRNVEDCQDMVHKYIDSYRTAR